LGRSLIRAPGDAMLTLYYNTMANPEAPVIFQNREDRFQHRISMDVRVYERAAKGCDFSTVCCSFAQSTRSSWVVHVTLPVFAASILFFCPDSPARPNTPAISWTDRKLEPMLASNPQCNEPQVGLLQELY
jgi:hypothetical protein